MHWLIRRTVESFLRDIYGDATWQSLWRYSDHKTILLSREWHGRDLFADAASHLNKPVDDLLEDLGAWIAHQKATRRLLRFSGRSFEEFLENLELLPDRVRMVVPDLDFPSIQLVSSCSDFFQISLGQGYERWTYVLAGMIRAMADDYGALGVISVKEQKISVRFWKGPPPEKSEFKTVCSDFSYEGREV